MCQRFFSVSYVAARWQPPRGVLTGRMAGLLLAAWGVLHVPCFWWHSEGL